MEVDIVLVYEEFCVQFKILVKCPCEFPGLFFVILWWRIFPVHGFYQY